MTDEEAIQKVVTTLADAMNRHDVQALARAFHDDADFTNVVGTRC